MRGQICLHDVGHSRLLAQHYLLGRNARCAEVTLEQQGRTFRLIADVRNGRGAGDAWHYERALCVELGVAHPTTSTLNGQWSSWPFDETPQRDGLLQETARWLRLELWNEDAEDVWLEEEHDDELVRRDIEVLCDDLGRLALECADPSAVAVARTLTRDVQFFAYSALLEDADGRVRQLIATCPALLSLASGLSPHEGDGAELLAGIRAGRKLNTLIADALRALSERTRTASHNERAVVLLRHAPSMPLLDLTRLLHAPGLDLNDSREQRQAWFRVATVWGRMAGQIEDPNVACAVGSFISKHGVMFAGRHPEPALGELVDWVVRSEASPPTRRTSPERVQREIQEWHETLYMDIELDPATRLKTPPTPTHSVPDVVVEPVLTVGELIEEGRRMRHCVASLAPEAVSGWVSVFRATVQGTRATVAAVRGCGGWGLMEAAGVANAPLDGRQLELLRYWVEALK